MARSMRAYFGLVAWRATRAERDGVKAGVLMPGPACGACSRKLVEAVLTEFSKFSLRRHAGCVVSEYEPHIKSPSPRGTPSARPQRPTKHAEMT